MQDLNKKIALIGGGNMARSLVGGLVAHGYPADHIYVVDPHMEKRAALAEQFGVHVEEHHQDVVPQVDVLILAVKPQVMAQTVADLAPAVRSHGPFIISV